DQSPAPTSPSSESNEFGSVAFKSGGAGSAEGCIASAFNTAARSEAPIMLRRARTCPATNLSQSGWRGSASSSTKSKRESKGPSIPVISVSGREHVIVVPGRGLIAPIIAVRVLKLVTKPACNSGAM
ncbi:hypothetical protein Vafri_10404, partial [Volvox africanus]